MTPDSNFSVVVLPAVGPQKGDELPLLYRQINAGHRLHFAILAVKQSTDGSP